VVIASNSTSVNAALLTAGLDWLLQLNNDPSREFYRKLDPNRAVTMGYSLGGGAALTAAAHPAVVTTIAMHPAPGSGAQAPVLLFSGSADTTVSPAMVDMSYNGLNVPTFYTSLAGATHLEPILTGGNELAPSPGTPLPNTRARPVFAILR
jgi:predicted dienelactone hydrolase